MISAQQPTLFSGKRDECSLGSTGRWPVVSGSLPETGNERALGLRYRRLASGQTLQASGLCSPAPAMTRAVGIIPARWGSTRFPGKPLRFIAGKPLLQHVWEGCRRARTLETVIIATDDMRIAEAAFVWGAEVSLTSPHHASGTDRIAEVAAKLRGVSHIINIQGDEPLVDPKLIDRFVRQMRHNPKIEMITAAHPFDDPADAASPHQVKVVFDRERRALYFSRHAVPFRQDPSASVQHFRHQGIYGYRRDLLLRFVRWKASPLEQAERLEQLRALENGVKIYVVVTRSGSPGVDTPDDARAIERQLLAQASRSRQRHSR